MSFNLELLTAEDLPREFFAPSTTDMVDGLAGQYKQARGWIEEVAEFANGEKCQAVLSYFLRGNAAEDRGRITLENAANQLFQPEGAIAQLNADYWQKALSLTDVYNAMPQERRNEWNEQIRNPRGVKAKRLSRGEIDAGKVHTEWDVPPLPDFEEETVRATLEGLLASRAKFLAERVDGIFRALSGEHVTNSPAAFGKRMIIAYLVTSYGTTNHDRVGYINDLQCVIAKFMGRDEPRWDSTSRVVEYARRERRGEWVTLDGGALRLRAYKCGTAHLEVHPDMAWRLNCVLAHLYPTAIPPEFRQKPKRKPREFQMIQRPLPFSVIGVLEDMEPAYKLVRKEGSDAWRNDLQRIEIKNALQFKYGGRAHSPEREEAERVLAYIGGVKVDDDKGNYYFAFDYNPREVLREIIASGCLPDQKTHQYYPTPASLATKAVELAAIGPDHSCLEPSAGQGGLADLMPKDRTRCVEISKLHCDILQANGHDVIEADFLKYVSFEGFDRIVMNPPFSEGRWQAHLDHAASMVKPGGRLVAILPASAKNKDVLPGFSCDWHGPYDNQFAGTRVSVVILVASLNMSWNNHRPAPACPAPCR